MKYDVKQFPEFKDGRLGGLSNEQKLVRGNRKHRDFYATDKPCKTCCKTLPISEYWFKDKKSGRRSSVCKDCMLKDQGVVEIGKIRFGRKIKSKGFKRCTGCKDILPFSEYHPSTASHDGFAYVCKVCSVKYTKDYIHRQREELSDYYVTQRFKEKHGRNPEHSKEIDEWRKVLTKRRAVKYTIDGKDFNTKQGLANYLLTEYGQKVDQTISRISAGCEIERLKTPSSEYRSEGASKGKVTMTDTVTGFVTIFKSVKEVERKGFFCAAAVMNSIKTGKPTRITKRSNYPNPVIFKRE
jgi:hypothetical protein